MKKHGFTLIELIIVIVILGILAVIAAPKFIDLQSEARISTLNGYKAAIEGANTMTRGYATLHGLDQKNLIAGSSSTPAMVRYDGNKIVDTVDDDNKFGVFFLNYGYIAVTYGPNRDSGLVQAIGKHSIKRTGFPNPEVKNFDTTDLDTKCPTTNSYGNNELCYISSSTSNKWVKAYLVLAGFTPNTCALEYNAAYKDSSGSIIPPQYKLITEGC